MLIDVTDEADDLAAYNQPDRPLDADMIEAIADFILGRRRAELRRVARVSGATPGVTRISLRSCG